VFVRPGPKRPPGETRRLVGELRAEGLSYSQIAARLDVQKSVVAYHARRLGVQADDRFARRYDWAEIQRAYDAGLSVRQCAGKFGFTLASWQKAVKRGDVVARPRTMAIELLLVSDRPQTNRSHLKQRLLDAGLKENRCERCGISEWQGEPITMHLHHVNGDGKDNRLQNIAFLCGNCHSQTDTYGGRNGHRRKRAA
jgi:5-methylcytosine-specific restriction endonuclease McrA